jgi:hypothetical protein
MPTATAPTIGAVRAHSSKTSDGLWSNFPVSFICSIREHPPISASANQSLPFFFSQRRFVRASAN